MEITLDQAVGLCVNVKRVTCRVVYFTLFASLGVYMFNFTIIYC